MSRVRTLFEHVVVVGDESVWDAAPHTMHIVGDASEPTRLALTISLIVMQMSVDRNPDSPCEGLESVRQELRAYVAGATPGSLERLQREITEAAENLDTQQAVDRLTEHLATDPEVAEIPNPAQTLDSDSDGCPNADDRNPGLQITDDCVPATEFRVLSTSGSYRGFAQATVESRSGVVPGEDASQVTDAVGQFSDNAEYTVFDFTILSASGEYFHSLTDQLCAQPTPIRAVVRPDFTGAGAENVDAQIVANVHLVTDMVADLMISRLEIGHSEAEYDAANTAALDRVRILFSVVLAQVPPALWQQAPHEWELSNPDSDASRVAATISLLVQQLSVERAQGTSPCAEMDALRVELAELLLTWEPSTLASLQSEFSSVAADIDVAESLSNLREHLDSGPTSQTPSNPTLVLDVDGDGCADANDEEPSDAANTNCCSPVCDGDLGLQNCAPGGVCGYAVCIAESPDCELLPENECACPPPNCLDDVSACVEQTESTVAALCDGVDFEHGRGSCFGSAYCDDSGCLNSDSDPATALCSCDAGFRDCRPIRCAHGFGSYIDGSGDIPSNPVTDFLCSTAAAGIPAGRILQATGTCDPAGTSLGEMVFPNGALLPFEVAFSCSTAPDSDACDNNRATFSVLIDGVESFETESITGEGTTRLHTVAIPAGARAEFRVNQESPCAPGQTMAVDQVSVSPLLCAECSQNEDCDDADPCTVGVCRSGRCVYRSATFGENTPVTDCLPEGVTATGVRCTENDEPLLCAGGPIFISENSATEFSVQLRPGYAGSLDIYELEPVDIENEVFVRASPIVADDTAVVCDGGEECTRSFDADDVFTIDVPSGFRVVAALPTEIRFPHYNAAFPYYWPLAGEHRISLHNFGRGASAVVAGEGVSDFLVTTVEDTATGQVLCRADSADLVATCPFEHYENREYTAVFSVSEGKAITTFVEFVPIPEPNTGCTSPLLLEANEVDFMGGHDAQTPDARVYYCPDSDRTIRLRLSDVTEEGGNPEGAAAMAFLRDGTPIPESRTPAVCGSAAQTCSETASGGEWSAQAGECYWILVDAVRSATDFSGQYELCIDE